MTVECWPTCHNPQFKSKVFRSNFSNHTYRYGCSEIYELAHFTGCYLEQVMHIYESNPPALNRQANPLRRCWKPIEKCIYTNLRYGGGWWWYIDSSAFTISNFSVLFSGVHSQGIYVKCFHTFIPAEGGWFVCFLLSAFLGVHGEPIQLMLSALCGSRRRPLRYKVVW